MNSCISGTFHHQEQEHNGPKTQYSSRKSRKRFSIGRGGGGGGGGRGTKNPYADRGLDKFSALLADLEDKRKKIYTQVGSEDISFVRFAYSNSNHCKPIVVKKKQEHVNVKVDRSHVMNELSESTLTNKYPIESPSSTTSDFMIKSVSEKAKKKKRFMGSTNWRDQQPCYYLVVIVILILLLLIVFGKSFTILCTSVGWYLVPAIFRRGGRRLNLERHRKKKKKKEYTRKVSENNEVVVGDGLSSPTSVITRAMNTDLPRQRGRCDSW